MTAEEEQRQNDRRQGERRAHRLERRATDSPLVNAVVVDDWPLVRIGVAQVLRAQGIGLAGETTANLEGVRLARASAAGLVVLGNATDAPVPQTVRSLKELHDPPRVVVLISQADREELQQLLAADVEGVVLRSAPSADLAEAVTKAMVGERYVAAATLGVLLGMGHDSAPPAHSAAFAASLLTSKERQVLAKLAEGFANKQIATALHVSEATVKTHLSNMYGKLGVENRQQALGRAVELGLFG